MNFNFGDYSPVPNVRTFETQYSELVTDGDERMPTALQHRQRRRPAQAWERLESRYTEVATSEEWAQNTPPGRAVTNINIHSLSIQQPAPSLHRPSYRATYPESAATQPHVASEMTFPSPSSFALDTSEAIATDVSCPSDIETYIDMFYNIARFLYAWRGSIGWTSFACAVLGLWFRKPCQCT